MAGEQAATKEVKRRFELMTFFQKEDGKVLVQNFRQVYADLLDEFTEPGLTAEQVKTCYDRLQGFLCLLRSWGGDVGEAKFLIEQHVKQKVADNHVEQTLGM